MSPLRAIAAAGRWLYRAVLPASVRQGLTPKLRRLPASAAYWLANWRHPSVGRLLRGGYFDQALEAVGPHIAREPEFAARVARAALAADSCSAKAYVTLAASLRTMNADSDLAPLAVKARDAGLYLINRGDLADGAAFFAATAAAFPEVCRPYALLYGQMRDLVAAWRQVAREKAPVRSEKRPIVIGLTVWGDRYTDLLTRYFIPSILSPGNVPALAALREIRIEIFTTRDWADRIRSAPSTRALERHAAVDIVEFPSELLQSPEYDRDPNLRYYIYGGFHHVSMEHARAVGGDVICIAPDGVHSDGSFTNYAKYVDAGYWTVLFTTTRGQAETLLPILDSMRDETSQSLTLPPRKLVDLAREHIHHDFLQFLMTTAHRRYPEVLTRMFFLTRDGFHSRNFHLHPIIISAEALRQNVAFDYHTVDANFIARLLPNREDWSKIKVLDDSDDGVMLDLTFKFWPPPKYPERDFHRDQLLTQLAHFEPNHLWHFSHRIVYRGEGPRDRVRTFDLTETGELVPRDVAVSSAIDLDDEALARWFEANRPKEHR